MDTLIQPCVNGQNFESTDEIQGYRSLEKIHGIKAEWLQDAPTLEEVKNHINMLCGKTMNQEGEYEPISALNFNESHHSVFIGHGVIYDLKTLGLSDVAYTCTSKIDLTQMNQARKLRDLSAQYLNAEIQSGHHSSIIDARCTLALFLKLRESQNLDPFGPQYFGNEEMCLSSGGAKRRKNKHKYISDNGMSYVQQHTLGDFASQAQNYGNITPAVQTNSNTGLSEVEQLMRSMNMIECELVRLILNEKTQANSEEGVIQANRKYQIDVNLLRSAIEQVVDEAVS